MNITQGNLSPLTLLFHHFKSVLSINEIKNSLEGINSRITEAEERISDLEDKTVEITRAE